MGWVLVIAFAWLVCAILLGLLLSRAMCVAEHRECLRRAARWGRVEASGGGRLPLPRAHTDAPRAPTVPPARGRS